MLTTIPDDFGQGGANLAPSGGSGTPTLAAVLKEHKLALDALQAGTSGPDFVARATTTGNRTLSGLTNTNLDGVTPVAGDVILVQAQTDASENGLYFAKAGAWTRITDATGDDVLKAGILIQVAEGTVNQDKLFILTTNDPIDVGTDNVAFGAAISASLAATTPAALGPAATAGAAGTASKSDHVHAWAEKKTVTITDATLVNAVNGSASSVNIGSALPAGAIVVAIVATLTTQFTGGGASAVAADVGWSGATEALIKDLDVFGGTAGGAIYDGNDGGTAATRTLPSVAPSKQLIATFTPDGGHNLTGLTAGSVTFDVYYVEKF